jgi:hypothetical protein
MAEELMTEEQMKEWIDNASYGELLRKWRFGDMGSPFFAKEVGSYFSARMFALKNEIGNEAHVRASKAIGWG